MRTTNTSPSWPVFDRTGRVVRLEAGPSGRDLVYQGRAYRGGQWLPWHSISATVYENRMKWPREGYQVRIAKVADPIPSQATGANQ